MAISIALCFSSSSVKQDVYILGGWGYVLETHF